MCIERVRERETEFKADNLKLGFSQRARSRERGTELLFRQGPRVGFVAASGAGEGAGGPEVVASASHLPFLTQKWLESLALFQAKSGRRF